MYSSNATRIYNPQPDSLECGPPKRVLREEQHIGERVAASKKRVAWRFTLGESDRTHEVALIHSVMSYKKVVQYDGRRMHFSSTATMGDWSYTMILDGLNMVMEVRINDVESAEIPKYDFIIDRIPYRRWDVYRRKKHAITTATYCQPNAPPGNAYGMHRWGPNGATPPSLNDSNWENCTDSSRGAATNNVTETNRTQSFGLQGSQSRTTSGYSSNERTRSYPGPQNSQQGLSSPHQISGQCKSRQEQAEATKASSQAAPPPAALNLVTQPDINLLDDFSPSVSVSAQALIFDPLVSVPSTSRGLLPVQQQQKPPVAVNSQPAPDPFASIATPVVTKATGYVNLDPFAPKHASNFQQQQQQQPHQLRQTPTGYIGQSAEYQTQQQQGMRDPSVVVALERMGNVNYNISHLMNPVSLQTGQQDQHSKSKSISIDAFASLGR